MSVLPRNITFEDKYALNQGRVFLPDVPAMSRYSGCEVGFKAAVSECNFLRVGLGFL